MGHAGAVEDVLDLISPDAKAEARLTPEEMASLVPDLQVSANVKILTFASSLVMCISHTVHASHGYDFDYPADGSTTTFLPEAAS